MNNNGAVFDAQIYFPCIYMGKVYLKHPVYVSTLLIWKKYVVNVEKIDTS